MHMYTNDAHPLKITDTSTTQLRSTCHSMCSLYCYQYQHACGKSAFSQPSHAVQVIMHIDRYSIGVAPPHMYLLCVNRVTRPGGLVVSSTL